MDWLANAKEAICNSRGVLIGTTILIGDMERGGRMAVWQVHEARTRLSAVIEEANRKGPQIITRHGAERAVILSVKDYRALTTHKPDLREYLLGGPKVDSFEVKRGHDLSRISS
jgi:antitoxin Phd